MTDETIRQRMRRIQRVPAFLWASFKRIPPLAVDALIAVSIAVLSLLSLGFDGGSNAETYGWLTYLLAVAMSAPLVVRRRWPLEALLVITALAVVYHFVGSPELLDLPLTFGLYAVAVYAPRRRDLIGAFVAVEALIIIRMVSEPTFDYAISDSIWIVLVLAIGAIERGRRERAALAEQSRRDEARRMVDEERLRIARELHDVVAHSIATISVQAGMASHVFDTQPEQARAALQEIRHVSRDALHELRATLGVLRSASDTIDDRAPSPHLDQLDELIGRAEAAGIHVAVSTSGPARDLPAAIDVTAYRIVQEALTNVVRHAGPATRATVAIAYRPDAVELRVTDSGPSNGIHHPPAASGSGLGLIGMRERVASVGGELSIGPRHGGGFEVRACLPTATPA